MKREEFVSTGNEWGSHRNLLWKALELTKHLRLPVIELGCGDESTPYLRYYCSENNLEFQSYDSNQDWANKHGVTFISDWGDVDMSIQFSVALVDMAPGEYRKIAVSRLTNTHIICIHDSEPPGWNSSDYRVRPLFNRFRYHVDDIPSVKGAPWTSLISNKWDVTN